MNCIKTSGYIFNHTMNQGIKCLITMCFIFLALLLSACAGKVNTHEPAADAAIAEQKAIDVEKQARFQRAVNHQKLGDYDQARVIFQSLLVAESASPEPDNKQIESPISSGKRYISPLINLGIIALKQEKPNEAKVYFEQVLEINKQNTLALNYLGVIAREAGEFDEAESYYRQVLENEPDNLTALRNLGILLDLYRGELAEALAIYEKYQGLLDEPDPKVKDWIFDTKNRLQD